MKLSVAFIVLLAAGSCHGETTDSQMSVTPLQKVTQILKSMKEKGIQDKHEEEVEYAAYKQSCDDITAEKNRVIVIEEGQVTSLKAHVQKWSVESDRLKAAIDVLVQDQAIHSSSLLSANSKRGLEQGDYTAAHKDYSESIQAIEKAIRVLDSQDYSTAAALLQDNKVPEAARHTIEAFLSRGEDDPLQTNSGARSNTVVEMLEKLLNKFEDERTKLEREEMTKKHAYELLKVSLEGQIKQEEDETTQKTSERGTDLQRVADFSAQESDATEVWKQEVKLLQEIEAECSTTAAQFKSRQELRAGELDVIQQAIDLMENPSVQGTAARLLQITQKKTTALAQLRSGSSNPTQLQVAAYLEGAAQRIGSHSLSMIAMKVRDDPFGKVKKMVQDLIIRLKEQANEEAQHKQWCDSELAQNEKSRTTRTDEVEKLQTEIDSLTSMSAKLVEEISMLSADIVEVDKASAEQTAVREETKTTNAATVKDAQEAQTAITNAITMLKNFYAEAAEAVALVQDKKQPSGVTIKKIFDGASPFSGSYNGKQGENTGVVGILEVIQSDFARLESETSAAEVTEQEDYNKFMKDSAVNKATKQADIKHKTSKKANAETRLGEIRADLAATSKELEAAQKYYEELKPSCLDTNVSFEDRDARRKEEIQSLQEAMRILNGEDMAV